MTRRRERSKITRIHRADFPQMKYLEELKREELPLEGQMILPEVETLDFIKEGRSIVMYGNPGTGKTHTAIGLGTRRQTLSQIIPRQHDRDILSDKRNKKNYQQQVMYNKLFVSLQNSTEVVYF